MGRVALLFLLAVQLAGCTAMSTITAMPAAVFDAAIYMVRGEEASIPMSMQRSLAASQAGLEQISMPADFVLPNEKGHLLLFGGPGFKGKLYLTYQTPTLTTIYVKVSKGVGRMDTVERTLIEEIRKHAEVMPEAAAFDDTDYTRLFSKPDHESQSVGWFRLEGKARVRSTRTPGWFRVGLAGGRSGFFRKG